MKIPEHIAVIMDGNGRWASSRDLPRTEGHRIGAKVADDTAHWCAELGVKYLTLYAFSTENWKRPKDEVEFLFGLTLTYLNSRLDEMIEEGVRFKFLGRLHELPGELYEFCKEMEAKTAHGDTLTVIVALNYGGRAEIMDAVNRALAEGKKDITEAELREYLYLPWVPDPDLIIRTSGEVRLSNFLVWESAYSEFYFTETLWPDFGKEDFIEAIKNYSRRKRRFGAVMDNEE